MAKQAFHQLDQLVEQELAIQAQEALAANAVWYFTRVMAQIYLPSSSYSGNEYEQDRGVYHLSVSAPKAFGVPWGIYPRGILNWMVTEVVRKKNEKKNSRVLELGLSLADFMGKVSGTRTFSGGKTGNIRPFKRQLASLLASRIFFWVGSNPAPDVTYQSMEISSSGNLMWHPVLIDQPGLIQSTIELGEKFHEDCLKHGYPVDIRIIRSLWPNCLAFDIYVWLTYRAYTLAKDRRWSLDLSWQSLKLQFGHQYKDMKGFRMKFLDALSRVGRVYRDMEFKEIEKGINFRFKRPSIPSIAVRSLIQG